MSLLKAKLLDFQDSQAWDRFVALVSPNSPKQLWQYGQEMTKNGHKVLRLGIISQGYLVMAAQIILEKKPILGNLAVVPEGPVFKNLEDLNESLPPFLNFLSHLAKTYEVGALKIEFRDLWTPKVETSDSREIVLKSSLFQPFQALGVALETPEIISLSGILKSHSFIPENEGEEIVNFQKQNDPDFILAILPLNPIKYNFWKASQDLAENGLSGTADFLKSSLKSLQMYILIFFKMVKIAAQKIFSRIKLWIDKEENKLN